MKKRIKSKKTPVQRSLVSFFSCPLCPHFGIQFLLLFMLGSFSADLLLQTQGSSGISGSALNSLRLTPLLWIRVCLCVRGYVSFCTGSAVVSCTCPVLVLTCSLLLSLFLSLLWGTALFLCSQVVNKGGIQFQERSLIGWFGREVWVVLILCLSPSSFLSRSLSLSGVFPTTFLSSLQTV